MKVISKDESGDVVKTGISGGARNADGSSRRANSQLSKLNNSGDPHSYTADVVDDMIPGRAAGLSGEKAGTEILKEQGNSRRQNSIFRFQY